MSGTERRGASPPAPNPEEPALLQPLPDKPAAAPKRSERNAAGYQETPLDPRADREAGENCALLHRARKEADPGCAAAENSPGAGDARA